MARLPLFEGIHVRPSGGRRPATTPLPEVVGTVVGSVAPTEIAVIVEDPLVGTQGAMQEDSTTEPVILVSVAEDGTVTSSVPQQTFTVNPGTPEESEIQLDFEIIKKQAVLQFDMADYVELEGLEPPYNVRLRRVEETSQSQLASPWTEGSDLVEIDENGIITYRPKGLYLWNRIELDFDLERPHQGPGLQPQGLDPDVGGRIPYRDAPVVERLESGKIAIQIDDKRIVGDPVEMAKLWENQGGNGICQLASLQLALDALKRRDPVAYANIPDNVTLDDLIELTSRNALPNGELLPPADGARGVITDAAGNPMYNIVEKPNPLFPGQTYKTIEINGASGGTGEIPLMAKHFSVESYTTTGNGILEIVKALQKGDVVIVAVDSGELWSKPVMNSLNDDSTMIRSRVGNAVFGADHVAVVTGIDVTDPDNPRVIISDSAGTPFDSYAAEDFLNAWEDGGNVIIGVGSDTPPDQTQKEKGDALKAQMFKAGVRNRNFPGVHHFDNLATQINRLGSGVQTLIKHMEENGYPDFGDDLEEYYSGYNKDFSKTLSDIGFSEEAIKKIRLADRDAHLTE